jgi:TonB family protein
MPPVDTAARSTPELHLLAGQEPVSSKHLAAMAAGSVVIHILLLMFFFSLPEVIPPKRSPRLTSDLRKAVHIYAPRVFEPTQKAPNVSKVVHPELDVRSELETPKSQAPKYRPPQPAPGPVARPVSVPTPPVIEPPKVQIATAQLPPAPPTIAPPAPLNGITAQAPPPPASAKPKISFENVSPPPPVKINGLPDPRLLMQKAAMDRIREETAPRTNGGGGVTVGDVGDELNDLSRANQAQSKGKIGSNLQLLSDANGYDFKPYLMKVLAAVRRNWTTYIPESAHMGGRRASVLIQFIIDRSGTVPKLVIASSSGMEAYDRAAISGITASTPFSPLPADFKGDQIRLQLSFSYNSPAR